MGPQPHRMPLFFHRSFETSCLCLFVFRQRFSGKIIYLSTVPSIDSPARGGRGEMEGRERERESSVFRALSQTLGPSRRTKPWYEGSSSVRNIIHCAGARLCLRLHAFLQAEWNFRTLPSPPTSLPSSTVV